MLTLLASPYGKKFPYIFLNSSTERCPLGQSFKNPLYHSCISASVMKELTDFFKNIEESMYGLFEKTK